MTAVAEHLPALLVVAPLMAAPLCVLVRSPRVAWTVAVAVLWGAFAAACSLLQRVLADGEVIYALGNWPQPWGIEFRVTALNGMILPLVSGIAALVLTYAPHSLAAEVPRSRHAMFHAIYLLCVTGLLGMTITGDAFNLFVFLEIASLSTYTLVSLGPHRKALIAAFRYLVMGTIGGTFYLIGVGLLYMKTGTLNMRDLAELLPAVGASRTVLAGFAFLVVGLSLKIALFPLHAWLPNAYAYAPSVVTSFLAATATKVSIYVLLRVLFGMFNSQLSLDLLTLQRMLLPLGLAGVVVASLAACFQTDVKKVLAYSSIAQVGYIVVGASFATLTGVTGALLHVFNHALMKGGLFLMVGCLVLRTGSAQLEDLRGLGKRMPFTMLGFVVGGLGLIGAPLTVGFVSKWYLVSAALEQGAFVIAGLLLLTSLLAVVYVWRVVETAYFHEPRAGGAATREAPLGMLVPAWVLIGASVGFGVDAEWTAGVAERAARLLLGDLS